MNIFTLAKSGRTLLLAAALAVGVVCWVGCGGNEENPADNNGDNGGDNGGIVDPKTVVKGTFVDNNADGSKTYKTVKIGKQTWMAENMSKKTADSWCYGEDGITFYAYDTTDNWVAPLLPADVQTICNKFGRLYTWEAAKTVCPNGWKLPDTTDWYRLLTAVGGTAEDDYRSTDFGKLMSSNGWCGWWDCRYGNLNNINGTDDYGFSALPGGERWWGGDCVGNCYQDAGYAGHWWTASADWGNSVAHAMRMGARGDGMGGGTSDAGYSVRCIKK